MINIGIYKITSPTGKIYIGQSEVLKRRFRDYKNLKNCQPQVRLYRSFLKYGVGNHTFEVIENCSAEDLNCRERFWQDFYGVTGKNGLNCVLQNSSDKPKVYSKETREKMSVNSAKFNLGKKFTEEHKKRIRDNHANVRGENNPNWNKVMSQKQRDQISKTRIEKGIGQGANSPCAKIILDTQTGIFYGCVLEASKIVSIHPGYLQSMLNPNSKDRNKTTLIYC